MGGQAQVVTFVLDALLARGEALASVLVLHLSPENSRVRRALAQLSAEFTGERYHGHPIQFRHLAVHAADGQPLPAIRNDREAEAAWTLGRDLLADLKREGRPLHVCIAGGPRILALTLTSAAMLHCDHRDRLWHLYTPRDFLAQARDGAILHAPPEAGVRLLRVPLMPWGAYFPGLHALTQPAPPPSPLTEPSDMAHCDAAWKHLTPRQREVVEALAEGLLPQEAADHLCISLKTLDTHKTNILAECRIAWSLPEDAHLTYHFVREKFAAWLATRGR
jgi:CRISPR-associated protein Csx14